MRARATRPGRTLAPASNLWDALQPSSAPTTSAARRMHAAPAHGPAAMPDATKRIGQRADLLVPGRVDQLGLRSPARTGTDPRRGSLIEDLLRVGAMPALHLDRRERRDAAPCATLAAGSRSDSFPGRGRVEVVQGA